MRRIIIILCCLFLIGCSGNDVTGSAVISVVEEPFEDTSEEDKVYVNELYDKIDTGMSLEKVESVLGEPWRVQKIEQDISSIVNVTEIEELSGKKLKRKKLFEYWYYKKGINIFQIGFIDGKVSTKLLMQRDLQAPIVSDINI